MQDRDDSQRQLLDVGSFVFLAEHRRELFPDDAFAHLPPSGRGRSSPLMMFTCSVGGGNRGSELSRSGIADRVDAVPLVTAYLSWPAPTLLSVTNSIGNWAHESLPVFEELYAAIEQMSLEAGSAGDSVKDTGSLEQAAPSVDLARERVASAAAAVRWCPQPPDAASAQHLAAMLDALDEFRLTKRFDDWVEAWVRAMEHRDAFIRAFAIASGQRPPAS